MKKINWKTIFYVLVIVSLILLIIGNLEGSFILKKNKIILDQQEKIKLIKEQSDKDTDGDGLEDWQELLYQTDPEREDTDGDGESDFYEISNNKDPLVYGSGNISNIIKINEQKKIYADLKEQKKDLKDYKERLRKEELERFNRYLKEKGYDVNDDIDTKKEKKKYSLENKQKKEEINYLAKIIASSEQNVFLENQSFKMFFDSITKYSLEGGYPKINQNDIEEIKKISDIYKIISSNLNKVILKHQEISYFKDEFSESYNNLSISLKQMLVNYFADKENNESVFEKYADGIKKLVLTRQKIHIYIQETGLNFSDIEPGSAF